MNRSTFGRTRDSRMLMLRNLAASVLLYETVTTTEAKARAVQPLVDKLIKVGQSEDRLSALRYLSAILSDEKAVKKVLDELAPRYQGVQSGFTRRMSLPPRLGDGARLSVIQLTKNAKLEAAEKSDKKPDAKAKKPAKDKA